MHAIRRMPRLDEKRDGPDKQRKRKAIIRLRVRIAPDTPEKMLWFAVLAQAVMDIGKKRRKKTFSKHYWNSDTFFTNRYPDRLTEISDYLDTDRSYILMILKGEGVWPLPYDYYI